MEARLQDSTRLRKLQRRRRQQRQQLLPCCWTLHRVRILVEAARWRWMAQAGKMRSYLVMGHGGAAWAASHRRGNISGQSQVLALEGLACLHSRA